MNSNQHKKDTVAALWDSQFDYDIYNGRQEGFSLKQVLSRTKKKYIRNITAPINIREDLGGFAFCRRITSFLRLSS